uniref:Uncharacterized protein n=1 Tax=Solibacter usitatus (strain Ellin6076) TaxID=234267 RepID=Q01QC7_SOLUE
MPEPHELMAQLAEGLTRTQSELVVKDIRDAEKAREAGRRHEIGNLTRQLFRIVDEHSRLGHPLFMSIGTAQIYIVDRRADALAECARCHVALPVHVEERAFVPYFLKCPDCGGDVLPREGIKRSAG